MSTNEKVNKGITLGKLHLLCHSFCGQTPTKAYTNLKEQKGVPLANSTFTQTVRPNFMKPIFKRIPYIIPAIIFLIALIQNFQFWTAQSSLGVSYLITLGVPTIIFLYQSVRISFVGWILVLTLYLAYLFLLILQFDDVFSLLGVKTDSSHVVSMVVVVAIYLAIGYLYIRIKPKGKNVL